MSVPADHEVPVLEYDETIPPRPEEEVADVARSIPDREGHGGAPDPSTEDPTGSATETTGDDTAVPDA